MTYPIYEPIEPKAKTPSDIKKEVEANAAILDYNIKLEEREAKIAERVDETEKRRIELVKATVDLERLNFYWNLDGNKLQHNSGRFTLYDTVDDFSMKELMKVMLDWHNSVEKGRPFSFIINSPGGYVIDGLAMYDTIRFMAEDGERKVTTVALGHAASMGGVLLQAGDERIVAPNSSVLIHQVSSGTRGSTGSIDDQVKHHKMLENRIIAILNSRTGMSDDEFREHWDRKDWWLGAQECVDLGFADRIGLA